MRTLYQRLRDWGRRGEVVQRFDEELEFHREQLEAEFRRKGLSKEEARAAARRELGNLTQSREGVRERAGLPALEEFGKDVACSVRGLLRRPYFSVSVVLILSLGIAASAIVHGLVASVFLRSLPVAQPEELHIVAEASKSSGRVSYGTASRAESLLGGDTLASFSSTTSVALEGDDGTITRARVRLVSSGFFTVLRLQPQAGRFLRADDATPGNPALVAVAAHGWAKRRFGSPEAAVGKRIQANGQTLEIVGVAPSDFRDLSLERRADFWAPAALQRSLGVTGNSSALEAGDRPNNPDWCFEERVAWLNLLVRAPDPGYAEKVTAAMAQAYRPQAEEWSRGTDDPQEREEIFRRTWPVTSARTGVQDGREQYRPALNLLGGIVAALLVLSCANVSGLLLVRTMSRHREMGVRLALGAGVWRAVRLVLTEAWLLCLVSGAVGLLLTVWILPLAADMLMPMGGLVVEMQSDSFLFAGAVVIFSTFASAVAPIVFISRLQPLQAIAGSAGALPSPGRVGRTLVVAQLALTMVLVAIAYSLGAELQRTLSSHYGFDSERVLTTEISPQQIGYSADGHNELMERLRAAILSAPGIESVAFASNGVMSGSQSLSGIYPRGETARVRHSDFQGDGVTPGYLGTLGMPILLGRDLATSDTAEGARVTVVTAALAQKVFGRMDVIGLRFGFDHTPSERDWTIVGVVADAKVNGLRAESPPMFFVPMTQFNTGLRFVAVRASGPIASIQGALRAAVSAAEPRLKDLRWKTIQQSADDGVRSDRMTLRLATLIAALAMVLAGTGIGASLSYVVLTRRKELAVRIAIGASPASLVRGVVREAAKLGLLGAVLGVIGVWSIPKIPMVAALLRETPGAITHLVSVALVLLLSCLAALLPALRAARTNPLVSLKAE